MTPTVWAVVVHFNGEEWIRQCLQSLSQSTLPLTIVVIDNQSTSRVGIDIIQNEFPCVTFIQSTENVGFGRANNTGLRLALENQADFAFLLNQDAWIEPDTVEKLVVISQQNPSFGIISPFHLNKDKSALEYGFANYLRADKCPDLISDIYFRQEKSVYPLPFVNAAAWLITKRCLQVVGGFDPLFFMYGEDVDYCQRCQYHHFAVGTSPQTTICHARDSISTYKKKFTKGEKYKLQGYVLSILKDINKPLSKQLLFSILYLIKEATRFKGRNILKVIWSSFPVFFKLRRVIERRRIAKLQRGPSFN